MQRDRTQLIAIITLALTGLIHMVETPEYYEEKRYVGFLFVAGVIGALTGVWGIWKNTAWGYWLGMMVAGGCMVAYVLSRTVGLPEFREASWSAFFEPLGFASLFIEAICVVACWRALRDQKFTTPLSLAH